MWTLGKFGDALHATSASKKVQGSSLLLGTRSQLASWLGSANQARSNDKGGKQCTARWHRNGAGLPTVQCTATSAAAGSSFACAAPRICILGGGFGGLYTAVRLHSLLWPQGNRPRVTLVDKSERFVFKPLLYEFVNGAASLEEVAPPFVKLLAPYSVNFVQAGVRSVEPSDPASNSGLSGGRVVLDGAPELEYDWLVLSLGSEATTLGVPGVKEFAYIFNSINDAMQVQRSVDLLAQRVGSEVVVVGSGPAGVELSATVAERLARRARVHLIATGPEILKGAPSPHRAAAESTLHRKEVSIIRNSLVTRVKESNSPGTTGEPRRMVELKDAQGHVRDLEADLVLWTAGSQPSSRSDPRMKLPFPTTNSGATQTDDTLRVVGHPRVFALGDLASAASQGQDLSSIPATAQVAFQQADYAAWNIWASIHNRPLLPFRYQHLGDMMSLGRADGAVTLPLTLPPELSSAIQNGPVGSILQLAGIRLGGAAEKGVTLEGGLGALVRRAAYLYRQPTREQRLEVGSTWLQQAVKASSQSLKGRGSDSFEP